MSVFNAGSLGKAATCLQISQPALTKSLRRLEDELGVPLFERNARGMKPTDFGLKLKEHAQAVAAGIDEAAAEITALKLQAANAVVLAAPPLLANAILVKPVVRTCEELPGASVRLITQSNDFIGEVLGGRCHLLVNPLQRSVPSPSLRQKVLFDDRLVLIMRRQHPLARKRLRTLRDFVSFGWALPDKDNPHWPKIEEYFDREGIPVPAASVVCNSASFIRHSVLHSNYIGITASWALPMSDFEQNSEMIVVNTGSDLMHRQIGFVWRNHQPLSNVARRLFKMIETSVAESIRDGDRRPALTLKAAQ